MIYIGKCTCYKYNKKINGIKFEYNIGIKISLDISSYCNFQNILEESLSNKIIEIKCLKFNNKNNFKEITKFKKLGEVLIFTIDNITKKNLYLMKK